MYVYILTNPAHTVLYIGITNDLSRRLHEHSNGLGDAGKFTGRYQTNLLIYFEPCPDPTQAIAREKQLKGWTRAKNRSPHSGIQSDLGHYRPRYLVRRLVVAAAPLKKASPTSQPPPPRSRPTPAPPHEHLLVPAIRSGGCRNSVCPVPLQ